MEWCPMCQSIKPISVNGYMNTWTKRCRDCNSFMGMFTAEEANKLIVERDYFKKIFYERELNDEKT